MKTAFNTIVFTSFLLISIAFSASRGFAEGSANLTPNSSGGSPNGSNDFIGYLQHDDGGNSGSFLKPANYGTYSSQTYDPLERLYVTLLPGETLYYGVKRRPTNGGNNEDLIITLRYDGVSNGIQLNRDTLLRDQSSTNDATLLALVGGNPQAGVIESSSEANAGPKVGGVPSGGYDPLSYTNTTGDTIEVYVEFTQVDETTLNRNRRKSWYDAWDFTVKNSSGVTQPGRLYTRSWSFTAGSGAARLSTELKLFPLIPSEEINNRFFVKEIDLAGMQPFGFFFNCNSEGTTVGTTPEQKRQSNTQNSAFADYKVFVQNPDPNLYLSASLPDFSIAINAFCDDLQTGSAVTNFTSSAPGVGRLIVDVNNDGDYDAGSDVLLETALGSDGIASILWDGKDANGNEVANNTTLQFVFQNGNSAVHYPLYDVENNDGFQVRNVRPRSGGAYVYWDDTKLSGGNSRLDGVLTTNQQHSWSNTNQLTHNTFTYGYLELDTLIESYSYTCNLDGDAVINADDVDTDNDGIRDDIECEGVFPFADADGDGVPNVYDTDLIVNGRTYVDANEDGINEVFDGDLDEIPNYRDLDSDQDGIPDAVEANSGLLPNNMSTAGAYSTTYVDNNDTDNDGLADPVDGNNGGTVLASADTDGDGLTDFQDRDSDQNGITDTREAGGTDANGDGIVDGFTDSNDNGINDSQESTALSLPDTDKDGIQDVRDLDSDGDGLPDLAEVNGTDSNGDGRLDGTTDADSDGLLDSTDPAVTGGTNGTALTVLDTDGDSRPNFRDIDSDQDGATDNQEARSGTGIGIPSGSDTDGDGLDNTYDGDNSGTALSGSDFDNDGTFNHRDTETDNDKVDDLIEVDDADGDGVASWDSNANGVVDGGEGTGDADGDGLLDAFDNISIAGGFDAQNATGSNVALQDTDNDGNPNFRDSDDDGDGILTTTETGDTNSNSIPDYLENTQDLCGVGSAIGNISGNVSSVVSSSNVTNPNESVGAADGTGASIGNNAGNQLTLDMGTNIEAGSTVELVVRRNGGGGTATLQIEESVDNTTYNANGSVSTNNTTFTILSFTAVANFQYLRLSNSASPSQVDAVSYSRACGSDTDNDEVADVDDSDIDNDGIPNSVELTGDDDGDGIANQLDLDTDNDGIPDAVEANNGSLPANISNQGSFGAAFVQGNDANNNGLCDQVETSQGGTPLPTEDFEGDGIDDYRDLDSDNDGVPDVLEAGTNASASGQIGSFNDVDGNGLNDATDVGQNGTILLPRDLDKDGVFNYRELDSDNDGISDLIEAGGTDSNNDGLVASFTDADNDGYDDNLSGSPLATADTDADGLQNPFDIDSDGDGIPDNVEAQADGSYTPPSGIDNDNDGIDNAYDASSSNSFLSPVDTDGADEPDYLDTDSDNDNVPDNIEGSDGNEDGIADNTASGNDADGDGLDEAFDIIDISNGFNGQNASASGTNSALQDTDSDVNRNFRDTNDDNDALSGNPLLTINEDNNNDGDYSNDFSQGQANNSTPDYLYAETTLPVSLVSFEVEWEGENARLRWETASELNNSHFLVQVSADGVEFRTIGTVNGHGTSFRPHEYDYLDTEVPEGEAVLYRLKQVDFDGSYEYAPVVVLLRESAEDEHVSLVEVGPTPSAGLLMVRFQDSYAQRVVITVESLTGHILHRAARVLAPGDLYTAQLGHFTSGLYIVRIQADGFQEAKKWKLEAYK